MSTDKEVLIKVENVSKKFCSGLKRSLFYGAVDIGRTVLGLDRDNDSLRKNEFWALQDISFELKRGECLGLIGHNGAGKSTLLKMLNGLIRPDKGKIVVEGEVGALIELMAGFNPILSGRENIYVNGAILGKSKKELNQKMDEIIEFSEIGDFIDSPVQNYSSGMKVRLGFAVAAQMQPDVLLIDEVLAVGDAGFRIKCMNKIGQMLRHSAVILVSHSMPMVGRICTEAMILDKGKNEWIGKSVGIAIGHYYAQFKSGEKMVSGSDKVSLESVNLTVPGNEVQKGSSLLMHQGQDLIIEMTVKRNVPVEKMAFTLVLYDQEMRAVADIKSRGDNFIVNVKGDTSKVVAVLKNLRLNAGPHALQVLVSDEHDNEYFANVQNVAHFNVFCNSPSHAAFRLSAEWREA